MIVDESFFNFLNDATIKCSVRFARAREAILANAKNRKQRRQDIIEVGNALDGKLLEPTKAGKRFWVFPDKSKSEAKL